MSSNKFRSYLIRILQSLLNMNKNVEEATRHPITEIEDPEATLLQFPYIGLDSFTEENADVFFGRRRLVRNLVSILRNSRFLAVLGSPGTGKSSLVLAGLIPALKTGPIEGSETWRYLPPITPGSTPLMILAELVQQVTAETVSLSYQVERFRENPHELAHIMSDSGVPAVLVVDQFEEIFFLYSESTDCIPFIANLVNFVKSPDLRHTVIITMRNYYEVFVQQFPELAAYVRTASFQITPPNAAELRRVIEEPARLAGIKFDEDVVEALIHDFLGEINLLPLLQFNLLHLWQQREGLRITRRTYDLVGGGRLSMVRCADNIYSALSEEDKHAMKYILLRIVRVGEHLTVLNYRVRRDELYVDSISPSIIDHIIEVFVEAGLLRIMVSDQAETTRLQITHEALVRNWPPLVRWVEEEYTAIEERRRIEQRAVEWVRLGRGTGGLLDEIELAETQAWIQSPDADLLGYDRTLLELIEASEKALQEAETYHKTQSQKLALALSSLAAIQSNQECVSIGYNYLFKESYGTGPSPFDTLCQLVDQMYPEINLNFYQFPSSVNVNHDALASLAISKSPDVDIFGIDTIWVQEFGAMGWCEPLNVHFPTLSASFVDTGLNIFSYRGQRLGIPIWMSTGGLFFNQEILSSFGVNVPGSYDELFEAASSIIRRQPELSGFLWSGAEEESLVMCWAEFFLGFGGHYFDNKGYCTINSNAGIASLEFMIKLLDQGVSPRETVTWTPEEARNRFVSGQAAFLRHNFDLAVWLDNPARSHVGGKWGVTPNPAQPRGKRACITGGFALALNPYTQNLEHALRVLSIIASSEMQRGFANAWGPLQCHRDIYHGQIGATSGYNASLSRKLASAFAIRPPSVCYSDLSDILQEKLHGALLGKATPKQALNSACAQIDDLHLL